MAFHAVITRPVGLLLAALAAVVYGQPLASQEPTPPRQVTPLPLGPAGQPTAASLVQAQADYAQARALQQANHPGCVDYFYAAISASWLASNSSAAAAPR